MIQLINIHQLALQALHVALMKVKHSQYLWINSTTLTHRNKSIIQIMELVA